MRLLNVFTFQLREFTISPPPYAILSYCAEHNEASIEEWEHIQRGTNKEDLKIIQRACGEAQNAGSEWLWNFAACVDKRSSAAQSEAINSLAQIYRDCEYSIVYLDDLNSELVGAQTIGEKLAECRWIKNIWSIPQIVFPREAYFYSSDWNKIGTKRSLLPRLSSIIGIDQPVLEDSDCLEDYSIARRMSWASDKTALRIEDYAYALFGLFSVSMPIIYGEGRKAFPKLQEEIMRDTDDFSLFAWDNPDVQEYNGLLAHSPAWFSRFRNGPMTPMRINGELQIHCAGITIETSLCRAHGSLFLTLEGQHGLHCYIPLSQWNGSFIRKGGQVEWSLSKSMTLERRKICVKRDLTARVSRKISDSERFIQAGAPRFHEPSGIGPRSSTMDYTSNDKTGSMASSVEDCGMNSQIATSVPISEAASQEDPIVWSDQEESSVRSTLNGLDSGVRTPSVHATTWEAQSVPEDYFVGDAENNSLHNDSICTTVQSGSHDLVHPNGSPLSGNQDLDVAQTVQELAGIAAEEFLSRRQRSPAKRSVVSWMGQNRKRQKLMKSFGQLGVVRTSDSEDGETVVVEMTRFFACPFYVRNKKYTECITRHQFLNVEDVKDHILWEHRQPVFCPLCKEEFPSGRTRDTHLRLRSCHLNDSSIPEGITNDQDDRLNREERSYLSEELKWFQVWDIVFPHIERPLSAFYTGARELRICAFRQFWIQSGQETVAEFLQKKECRSYSIQNEERKLQAIYDLVMENVVDSIFFDFSD